MLFDQDFFDDEDDTPFFVRSLFYGKNINLTIEFSDYAVSQALYATVEAWVGRLPVRMTRGLTKVVRKNERSFRSFVATTTRFATLLAGASVASRVSSIHEGFSVILIFIGLAFLLYTISNSLIDSLFVKASRAKPLTNLILTDGDKAREEDIKKKQKRAGSTLYFILFGIIFTLVVGVSSSAIYDMIKSWLSS